MQIAAEDRLHDSMCGTLWGCNVLLLWPDTMFAAFSVQAVHDTLQCDSLCSLCWCSTKPPSLLQDTLSE